VRSLSALKARLPRPTIRLKLTLWYGGMFLLAGALLLTVTDVLVRQGFQPAPGKVRAIVAQRLGIPEHQLAPGSGPGVVFPGEQPGSLPYTHVGLGNLIHQIQQEQMSQQLRQLLTWSGVALGIMALLSLLFGWILAGRLLRPVHELTALAQRLSESTLHERIHLERPPDELKELADTFDGMLERLDRAFAGQRDFVANASHELRTPLTIIRTELDVAMRDPDLSREEMEGMAAAVRDALDRSEGLIDSLLLLARSEAPIEALPVDLAMLVQEAVDRHAEAADERALGVELALQPAIALGDPKLLATMLDNLIDNAVRHNIDGGWFIVATAPDPDGARLTVTNSGPVLSEAEAARLFDRFFRADPSRSRRTGGSGLGLSIAKAVAEAHRGTVRATARPEGGLQVEITLPAPRPAEESAPRA
jgi:signal transduction histidine kinase